MLESLDVMLEKVVSVFKVEVFDFLPNRRYLAAFAVPFESLPDIPEVFFAIISSTGSSVLSKLGMADLGSCGGLNNGALCRISWKAQGSRLKEFQHLR